MADMQLNQLDLQRLGTVRYDGSIELFDKNRDFRRIRRSARDVLFLDQIGFVEVLSSNVSAIRTDGDDLLVLFHNNSVYRYYNQAHHYEPMLMSNSKGRYVWQHFRWKQVMFHKEASIITPSGVQHSNLTYEQIGERFTEEYKRFNIPIQDSTEDILKTLINLYSRHIDINQLELINVLGLLKGIYGPNLTS